MTMNETDCGRVMQQRWTAHQKKNSFGPQIPALMEVNTHTTMIPA